MACSKSEHTSAGIWPKLRVNVTYLAHANYAFKFLAPLQPVNIKSERTSVGTWPKMFNRSKDKLEFNQ